MDIILGYSLPLVVTFDIIRGGGEGCNILKPHNPKYAMISGPQCQGIFNQGKYALLLPL